MAELTKEQALARARARLRLKEKEATSPGTSPSPAAQQSALSGVVDAVTQGASFGFGDELTGLESAVLGRTPEGGWFDYSKPFGERYDRAVAAERGQQEAFAEENPTLATGAEIGGALATGLGAGRAGLTLAGRAGSTAGAAGLGAVEGAAYGGLYGAGTADDDDRLAGATQGAALGAATGGVLSGGIDAVTRALSRRAAVNAAPTTADLRRMADQRYAQARLSNPTMPGFGGFVLQARQTLDQEGFHPRLHPKLNVVLEEFDNLAASGAPDFQRVEQMRRIARSAAGSLEADERRLGRMLIDGLDNYVETVAPNPAIREGRQLYSRFRRSDLLDEATTRARDRAASTYSGGNLENAERQQLRRILDNPRLRRGFSQEEQAAIRETVRGTPMQNVLRALGKLSPTRGGVMSYLGAGTAGAGAATGNPLLMALPVVGAGAKAMADRGSRASINELAAMVRSGGPLNIQGATPEQLAIARALAGYLGSTVPAP